MSDTLICLIHDRPYVGQRCPDCNRARASALRASLLGTALLLVQDHGYTHNDLINVMEEADAPRA